MDTVTGGLSFLSKCLEMGALDPCVGVIDDMQKRDMTPENTRTFLHLQLAFHRKVRQLSNARQIASVIEKEYGLDSELALTIAEIESLSGNLDAARQYLDGVTSTEPLDVARVNMERARIHLKTRAFGDAESCALTAIQGFKQVSGDRRRQHLANVYMLTGSIYAEQAIYNRAIRYMRKSAKYCVICGLPEATAMCLFNIAKCQYKSERFKKAENTISVILDQFSAKIDISIINESISMLLRLLVSGNLGMSPTTLQNICESIYKTVGQRNTATTFVEYYHQICVMNKDHATAETLRRLHNL